MREAEGIINNAGDGRDRGRNRQIIKYNLLCIVINLVLAVFKLTVGMIIRSRAIVMDGVNGLSDMLSSVISFCVAVTAWSRR